MQKKTGSAVLDRQLGHGIGFHTRPWKYGCRRENPPAVGNAVILSRNFTLGGEVTHNEIDDKVNGFFFSPETSFQDPWVWPTFLPTANWFSSAVFMWQQPPAPRKNTKTYRKRRLWHQKSLHQTFFFCCCVSSDIFLTKLKLKFL